MKMAKFLLLRPFPGGRRDKAGILEMLSEDCVG